MSAVQDMVTIGDCTLYLGDMREVLPEIAPVEADMCMSDPPYRLTTGGNTTGVMKGCFAKDQYDNSGEFFDMVEWDDMAPVIFDALKDSADTVIMTSDREEPAARAGFEAAGFRFHRMLVWDKITATANRWYMPNCEFALYLYKGQAVRIRNCRCKALIRARQTDVSHHYLHPDIPLADRKAHQTEKPPELMAYWICNSTDLGDTVLDPFMGTGSTAIGAVRSGRRFVGVEKDPKWFHVACERVAEAVERPSKPQLFSGPEFGPQGVLAV